MKISTISLILAALACIIPGILTLLFPKGAIYRMVSWRYREEDGAKAAPILDRLGGGFLILAGILILFSALL